MPTVWPPCEYMLPPLRSELREDDLLAKADFQANPEKESKTPCTEFEPWFDNKRFKMQDLPKSSNLMTSRYVYAWKFVKNEKGGKPETVRERGSVQYAMDHCFPRRQHGLPGRVDLPGTCRRNW
eukprot:9494400-Pyramimonas_sp.AAC.1